MMSTELVVALIGAGTIVISTGLSTWISLAISKRNSRQRLAEFRKEWIENLRNHLSEYIGVHAKRVLVTRLIKAENDPAEKKILRNELSDLNSEHFRLNYYLRMNLNIAENEHQELDERIEKLRNVEFAKLDDEASLVNLSRSVLKKEWDRLKKEI